MDAELGVLGGEDLQVAGTMLDAARVEWRNAREPTALRLELATADDRGASRPSRTIPLAPGEDRLPAPGAREGRQGATTGVTPS